MDTLQVVIEQKAFIVNTRFQTLIIEHELSKSHNLWDLPGGRFANPDTLRANLIKHVKNTTSLDLTTISLPLGISVYLDPRDRNLQVLRIIYLCQASNETVVLPTPQRGFLWIDSATFKEFPFPDEGYLRAFDLYPNVRTLASQEFLSHSMTSDTLDFLKHKNPNPLL